MFNKLFLNQIFSIGIFCIVFMMTIHKTKDVYSQSFDILTYQKPPKAIADLIDTPPDLSVNMDPAKEWLLIQEQPNLISLKELTQPELRLAGIRFNPKTQGQSRSRRKLGSAM
jgi:hypothetical protein